MNQAIFIPIGGAESKLTLSKLVHMIGGGINVLVITTATLYKKESEEKYKKIFTELNCDVYFVNASEKADVDTDLHLKLLDNADLVFFVGGDQSRISNCFLGTNFLIEMKRRSYLGLVISGTSAGAAVMSSQMIAGGVDIPKMSEGLSFLSDIVIDSHFSERNRITRLRSAISKNKIGLGISEDTGVVIKGRKITVFGSGNITIVTQVGEKILTDGESIRI